MLEHLETCQQHGILWVYSIKTGNWQVTALLHAYAAVVNVHLALLMLLPAKSLTPVIVAI